MSTEGSVLVAERDWTQFVVRTDFEELAPLAQALFVHDAMTRLGMSRDQLALRIGVSRKCLGKWMARHGTAEFRTMPSMAWKFIGEILAHAGRLA